MSVERELALPNGDRIPTVGFGTWTVWQGAKDEIYAAVKEAIKVGYRHIDCAYVYNNEEEVGRAIQEAIADGTVTREELFITTKAWNTAHRREAVMEMLKKSLANLRLTYVNLYLVHYPISFQEGEENFPKDDEGNILFEYHDILDTWKGMEDCVDNKLARSIGLSNFNHLQVQRIIDNSRIKPSVIQIEVNPVFSNSRLVQYCQDRNLVVTSYAPLGAPKRPWQDKNDPKVLEEPAVKDIAQAKGRTVAQVVLRHLLQRGLVVIPKSSNPGRIRENFGLFDFELSGEDMTKLASIDRNFRAYSEPICASHPEYPYNEF